MTRFGVHFRFKRLMIVMSSWYLLLLLLLLNFVAGGADDSPIAFVRDKYDRLPDSGKIAVGAAVGYVGSRVVVKSAVGVVKVAGATFIVTELLNFAGVMDELPKLSDDQQQILESVKQTVVVRLNQFRRGVRRQLNPVTLRRNIGKEKLAAMGAAGGALLGFVL